MNSDVFISSSEEPHTDCRIINLPTQTFRQFQRHNGIIRLSTVFTALVVYFQIISRDIILIIIKQMNNNKVNRNVGNHDLQKYIKQ